MNLQLFLSDRCNMACDYCFLRLNEGPATILSEAAALGAVRGHLARHPGGGAQITLLGGEPTMHLPLMPAGARAARGAKVSAATNGTLLCPETAAELSALGVELAVSVDGAAEGHDRHRRLLKGGSSHEEILKATEGLGRSKLRANMVVGPDTAGALLRNLEAMRGAGWRRLSFHLDVRARWDEGALRALSVSLAGVERYLGSVNRKGDVLELTNLESSAEIHSGGAHGYDDVVLGADGKYYPCASFLSKRYGDLGEWVLGDAEKGLDTEKRERIHGKTEREIHAALKGGRHGICPRETYFLDVLAGRDPAPAVRAFHRADILLGEAFLRIAAHAREAVRG